MLRILMLVALALSTAFTAGNQEASALVRRTGKLSTVTLLYISRTSEGTVRPDGANGVITFHWLIEPARNASGPFTIAAPKDFTVDGQRFSELSQQRLGKTFESETIIEEASDFKAKARPELRFVFPATVGEGALVMSTAFRGPILVAKRAGEVVIDVGWGDRTELFTFGFEIPSK